MEERKWENLNSNCLANVFGRLDLETRVLDVPLVCKHWHQALVNPLCWQKLDFPVDIDKSRLAIFKRARGSSKVSGLIKFVVDRSKGFATTLYLPEEASEKDLIYVSDVCPSLKILTLPCTISVDYGDTFSKLIVKWKSLEVLKSDEYFLSADTIDKIGLYCKNFVELSSTEEDIDQEMASAIVSKLVTIKRLVLDHCRLTKDDLVRILRGCKELELLYVRKCTGFEEDDEEILQIASRIKDFRCEGSHYKHYVHEYLWEKYYREWQSLLLPLHW